MEPSAAREFWRQFEHEHDDVSFIDDVCKGVRLITDDGAPEPHDVIGLAVAGAEAAQGLSASLDQEWALYTPRQAAFTASALFAQLTAAGAALGKLEAYLDVMAERGDIAAPDFDGQGDARKIADAQVALGSAAQEVDGAMTDRDTQAVGLLSTARWLTPQPASTHETVTALAPLLGQVAALHPGNHAADQAGHHRSYDDSCGCRIDLTDGEGERWRFQREDGAWSLVRQEDGHTVELDASAPCADPRHMAALVHRVLQSFG
ncbi:hypothetical protein [Streptomyces canus]|uniref:hypothetical protein n=1 Tax=Streptomyces canus TaxID=58343 RepID=UPI002E30E628|nr:hypothetical protein [Streptomyces canus]